MGVSRKEAEYYDEIKIEDLFYEIGRAISDGEFYDSESVKKEGEKWFSKQKDKLKRIVCDEIILCDKIDDPLYSDRINLIIAMADSILISKYYVNYPVVLISVLICKIGVKEFCDCE